MKHKDEMVLVYDSFKNEFLQKSYKTRSGANMAADKMNENCETLSIPRKPKLGIFDVMHRLFTSKNSIKPLMLKYQ